MFNPLEIKTKSLKIRFLPHRGHRLLALERPVFEFYAEKQIHKYTV